MMTEPKERIVIGVDGSSASIDALKWAIRQAALTGAAIEAVIGWQYPTVYGGYPIADTTDWPSNAKGILDTACQRTRRDSRTLPGAGHPKHRCGLRPSIPWRTEDFAYLATDSVIATQGERRDLLDRRTVRRPARTGKIAKGDPMFAVLPAMGEAAR